jgi:hypothetical protein
MRLDFLGNKALLHRNAEKSRSCLQQLILYGNLSSSTRVVASIVPLADLHGRRTVRKVIRRDGDITTAEPQAAPHEMIRAKDASCGAQNGMTATRGWLQLTWLRGRSIL